MTDEIGMTSPMTHIGQGQGRGHLVHHDLLPDQSDARPTQ